MKSSIASFNPSIELIGPLTELIGPSIALICPSIESVGPSIESIGLLIDATGLCGFVKKMVGEFSHKHQPLLCQSRNGLSCEMHESIG